MGPRALIAALAIILALSAYDIIRAATVRCVRLTDERRVLTVSEMDSLPGHIAFKLDRVPQLVRVGSILTIRGSAYDTEHGRSAAAVLAIVDRERVAVTSYSVKGHRFDVALSFAPGSHDVTFKVVASDLAGYYVPKMRVAIVAR